MRVYVLQPQDDEIEAKLVRTVKPHTTPVVSIAVDSTSTLLATGGADGVVKVWDIRGGFVTHTFHGHSGLISALHFFHVDPQKELQPVKSKKRKNRQRNEEAEEMQDEATAGYRLASGGEDGKVRIWDLHKRKSIATLDSHVSVVRSLDFSPEKNLLLSASRDKTAIMWDASTWGLASTVAVLETIEKAGFVENGTYFYTGGDTARLRIWSTDRGNEITEDQEAGSEVDGIVDVLHFPNLLFLLTVHADQTLVLRSVEPLADLSSSQTPALPIVQRISGTHDEVIDLAYVGRDRNLLALATNLEDIRLISLETKGTQSSSPYFGADVALLKGHDDIIITIDTDWSGHWLATGAKDNTAKLWRLDPENNSYDCFATLTGHAESIGAVALPNTIPAAGSKEFERPLDFPPKFMITGSQDKTIKRWDISPAAGKAPRAAYTRKAHDKDINAIETSFSSPAMFASASQDRTVKIWDVETGEAIGVLRGHKRGVWTVAFSPIGMPALTTTGEGGAASTAKGMVVTGSGDKTVRIWSLTDYSCLRTFEGHANSVLKVLWLPPPGKKAKRGVQVASAAGDGLVKVWNAQDGECAATLDNHIDRVWALAVRPKNESKAGPSDDEETEEGDEEQLELVSGSADSTLTFWTDTTATTALAATTHATARIEQDQQLQNHIRSKNFREAIVLALQLDHPKRLLELFGDIISGPQEPGSFTGRLDVDDVLKSLSGGQLWNLVCRVRDWNANGRTKGVAQKVLYALLRLFPKERLLALGKARKKAGNEDADADLAEAMAELDTRDKSKRREGMKDVVDGLKAYTERHYTRLEKTGEERFVLLWALGQMDDVAAINGKAREEDVMMLEG